MKQKNLLLLSAVTVAALAVAALSLRKDGGASGAPEKLLFPALGEHLNEITEVHVEKAGKSATLRKEGGQWKLTDRGGYPAQFEKIKELAVKVAELEIEEAKTSKKANHAKLGVEWPSTVVEGSEDAVAGLATFKDAGGKELASVVIGKSEWQGSKPKIYARRTGEDQVYLCRPTGSGGLDLAPEARQWIEPKFLDLDNERVQNVSIEHADGETIAIARSTTNHTQFKVQNVPPGRTEKYDGVATGVATALSNMQLDDVRAVTEVDFTQSPLAKARFKTVDGLELVLETAKFEDKTWVKVVASYTPPPEPPAEAKPAEGEAPAGEGDKPAESSKKDVAKEAAELNQRLAPWAFEVASYKTDVLARHMAELLDDPNPAAKGEDGGLEGAMQQMGLGMEEDQPVVEPTPATDDEKPAPSAGGEPKPE
ncbi:MAG: DUF4340 domain-containing protein [Planctomycetes bacterium]|nr:DUF4340 domain-containing protein [Planctomycetota bacterium]